MAEIHHGCMDGWDWDIMPYLTRTRTLNLKLSMGWALTPHPALIVTDSCLNNNDNPNHLPKPGYNTILMLHEH